MRIQTSCLRALSLALLTTAVVPICNAQITLGDLPNSANVTLWLKADTGVSTDINGVTQWQDGSNSGFHLSASGGPQPQLIANGQTVGLPVNLPVVQFDGVQDVLSRTGVDGTSLVSANSGAFFVVLKANSQDVKSILGWVDDNAPGNGYNNLVQVAENGSLIYLHGDAGQDLISAPKPGDWATAWHVLSVTRTGSSGDIRVDGQSLSPSGSFNGSGIFSANGTLAVGSLNAGENWGGNIAEILAYNSGSIDVAGVENYLGTKYGLTPVPEPSEYAMIFGVICVLGALVVRSRRVAVVS